MTCPLYLPDGGKTRIIRGKFCDSVSLFAPGLSYTALIFVAIIEGILIIEELQNGDYPLNLKERFGISMSWGNHSKHLRLPPPP
jgi:hypothetical protein